MTIPSCANILPYLKPGWVGVEIGVQWGISALALIQHGCFLYLVDPWVKYEGYGNVLGQKWDAIEEEIYRECRERLAAYDDGRHFAMLRMKSEDAARFIPDNLDFVWVDGNHNRSYVQKDLELYWPKIRRGGILCGHDYGGEVKEAVDAFADSIVSFVIPKEGSCWVMFK